MTASVIFVYLVILISVILASSHINTIAPIEPYANSSPSEDQSPEVLIINELKQDSKNLFGVTKEGTLLYVDQLFVRLDKYLKATENELNQVTTYIDKRGRNLMLINNMGGNPGMLPSIYNIDDINQLKKKINNIKQFSAYHLDQYIQLANMNIQLIIAYYYDNKYGKTFTFPKSLDNKSQIISQYRTLKTEFYSSMAYLAQSMVTKPVEENQQ